MKKLCKIVLLAAVLAALMTVTCYAGDTTANEAEAAGLSGAVESVLHWCADNPETVMATVITGVAGGINLAGGVSNRKTRRRVGREAVNLQDKATAIHNNAVKLAGDVTKKITDMIASVSRIVGDAVKTVCAKLDEVVAAIREQTAEIKSLRRETKGNSFLMREMLKDAQLSTMRKDEIERGYKDIMGIDDPEEVEPNDECDEA